MVWEIGQYLRDCCFCGTTYDVMDAINDAPNQNWGFLMLAQRDIICERCAKSRFPNGPFYRNPRPWYVFKARA